MSTPPPPRPFASVRRRLLRRLEPALWTAAVAVALVPPVLYFAARVAGRRSRALWTAQQTARAVAVLARRRPDLWIYDSPKVLAELEHGRVFAPDMRVVVVTGDGRVVASAGPSAAGPRWIWARAQAPGTGRAAVWTALPLVPVVQESLAALAACSVLALSVASWIRRVVRREAERADADLQAAFEEARAAHRALVALTEDLESQVAARSAELARALSEMQAKDARLREASRRATEAVERERRAIARELHDAVGQTLTAIRLRLHVLASRDDLAAHRGELSALTELCDTAIDETRRAVDRLGPSVIDDAGLAVALRRLAADLGAGDEPEVRFDLDGAALSALEASPARARAAFRIVQEALNNAVRHGRARHVGVRIGSASGGAREGEPVEAVEVVVEDDGVGFDPAAAPAGHGLASMRERAELLGGSCEVTRRPEGGTRVCAVLPGTSVG